MVGGGDNVFLQPFIDLLFIFFGLFVVFRHQPHDLLGLEVLEPEESAIFAPCDLPFIDSACVSSLAKATPPAVAFDGQRIHPLFGHFGADARARLLLHLEKQGSARAFAEAAERVVMPSQTLRNINHPADLDSV